MGRPSASGAVGQVEAAQNGLPTDPKSSLQSGKYGDLGGSPTPVPCQFIIASISMEYIEVTLARYSTHAKCSFFRATSVSEAGLDDAKQSPDANLSPVITQPSRDVGGLLTLSRWRRMLFGASNSEKTIEGESVAQNSPCVAIASVDVHAQKSKRSLIGVTEASSRPTQ